MEGYNLAYVECSENLEGLPVRLELILVEDINELEDFDVDDLPPDMVQLYRYEGNAWNSLGGTLVVEDDKLIFRAEFTGLSLFGIFSVNPPEDIPASKTLPRTSGALPLSGLACTTLLATGAAILRKRRR